MVSERVVRDVRVCGACFQADHKLLLRPTLGHPNARDELGTLMTQEQDRHKAYLAGVDQHSKTLQVSAHVATGTD